MREVTKASGLPLLLAGVTELIFLALCTSSDVSLFLW